MRMNDWRFKVGPTRRVGDRLVAEIRFSLRARALFQMIRVLAYFKAMKTCRRLLAILCEGGKEVRCDG